MSSSSVNSYRRDRPSYLRFDNDQKCRVCGKPLQILVVGPKSPNYQRLYYACPTHKWQAWCYAINEGEIHLQNYGEWKENGEWKNKYKSLKKEYKRSIQECKSLNKTTEILKIGLAVMILIVSVLGFLIVRRT